MQVLEDILVVVGILTVYGQLVMFLVSEIKYKRRKVINMKRNGASFSY